MKRGLLFLLISYVAVLSCTTDEPAPVSITTGPKSGWVTINLNMDYTIQFPPATYQGNSYSLRTPGSFGDTPASINRNDGQATLYTFCNPNAYPCLLIPYAQTLPSPVPASVPYLNAKGETRELNNTTTFFKSGKQIAMLYYARDPEATEQPYTGHLYLRAKESGQLEYASRISFTEATLKEIQDILSTLSPR
nr:hypothetical protein [uncultured Arsenicibacter sp.]